MTIEKAEAVPGVVPGPYADAQFFSKLGYQINIVLVREIRECLWEIFTGVALRAHGGKTGLSERDRLRRLPPETADRVTNDAQALLEKFVTMKDPIKVSLEAWATGARPNAVSDKNRRDRGERGALQKARVPEGLKRALGHDPLLVEIARRIIDFAGTPRAVGGSGWPTGTWSSDLAPLAGAAGEYPERACERDVERVLHLMAAWNQTWLDQRILGPLSRQALPVAFRDDAAETDRPGSADERDADQRDRLLLDAAADLLDALADRLAVGDGVPAEVAREVLEEFEKRSGVRISDRAVDEILAILAEDEDEDEDNA